MKILRSKFFADPGMPPAPNFNNSQEAALEGMKLQRQLIQTQRMREQLRAQEARDKMRNLQAAQRLEQKKDEQLDKMQVKVAKMGDDSNVAKNVSLFKTRSKAVEPVSMK